MTSTTDQTGTTTSTTVRRTTWSVEIEVVTAIDAPAAAVWSVLAGVDRYAEWNPLITAFDGDLDVGRRVTARLAVPGRRPVTMRPRIVDVEHGRSFTWLGSVGVRGLLDGRHHFRVEPIDDERSRFVHHERLTGALVPLVRRMLTVDTPAGFAAMNAALADRVAPREPRD